MARVRCNSCGGEFESLLGDGMIYFHACPPITRVRVKRGAAWVMLPLQAVQPTDTIAVTRGGVTVETTVALVQPGDVRLGDDAAPRANARNENVKRRLDPDADVEIEAEGAGVTPVP